MAMTAQPASAASAPYACPWDGSGLGSYGFCLFYNSGGNGAKYAMWDPDPDLAGSTFNLTGTTSAGYGKPVKNNAASAYNGTRNCKIVVYYNSNYDTRNGYDIIYPGEAKNLQKTYNENASVGFHCVPK
ncbi:peptidase inhibitor family I36 protein [Streptomyces zaomyceticus]|uniref:peptidase inhibitor family I36 protein n=1 Tax=Streptomyces zaomyceticus TaxID=68286 RepID=UPI003990BBA9